MERVLENIVRVEVPQLKVEIGPPAERGPSNRPNIGSNDLTDDSTAAYTEKAVLKTRHESGRDSSLPWKTLMFAR